jgi:Ice-binding-like
MNRFESVTKPMIWSTTLLLAAIVAGCGGGSSGSPTNAPGTGLGPTGGACTGASCVNLGKAANYAILAKTGVSTVPNSVVTGNVGLSPAARTFLTGWSLIGEPTDTSFGSAQVVAPGRLFAADNVGGTTSVDLTTAVGDMQTAYTTANGLAPAGGGLSTACPTDGTTVGALGGVNITPGVYTCTVPLSIAAGLNVTLTGTATDVWVIRTTQGMTQAAGTQVILAGGAVAQNVFWVPAMTVSIGGSAGGTTKMAGVILAKTNIAIGTNATVNGRLLAQTAVTLDQATITQP